jgi:hypothetical protein
MMQEEAKKKWRMVNGEWRVASGEWSEVPFFW